jgi:hypothetical protein
LIEEEDAPIEYRRFSIGVPFSDEVIRDMITPLPPPPLGRRVWRELSWRIPHAWRVLIHGECDAY